MNQAEEAPRGAATRKLDPAGMNDGYDPRQQRNDTVLGIVGDERRSIGVGQRSGDYQRGNPRAAAEFGAYRHDAGPARAREFLVDEPDTRSDIDPVDHPMASHPLFLGLLQELPPRTAPPTKEWLDQWSATTRSILDLLYSRDPIA